MTIRRSRIPGLLALVWLALLAPLASAQEGNPLRLKDVGDERPIGRNRTGEECRIRLLETRSGYERFGLFCDGWTQASGDVRRFRASPQAPPARLLTDSAWQKGFATRAGDCGPVEPTALAAGGSAGLRECKRLDGGWRVLVVAAHLGPRAYALESFPTNLPLLEAAVEVLEGRRALESASPVPLVSAAIRRSEGMVGASGRLIGIQDVGAHAMLFQLGRLRNFAGDYAASESAFRRALEIEERTLGPGHPISGDTLTWIAFNVSAQRRFAEADRLYARAEPLVARSFVADHHSRHLTHRAFTELRRGDATEALRLAQDATRMAEARGAKGRLAHSVLGEAIALRMLKRLDEAERAAARSLSIVETPGHDAEFRAWWGGESYLYLGLIHADQGRYPAARAQLEKALERERLLFGDSVRAATVLDALGRVGRLEGDLAAALTAYRRAAENRRRDPLARDRARAADVVEYLDALLDAARGDPGRQDALHAEAFAAAQIPRGAEVSRAITSMTARLAAAEPSIGAVAREYQEATRQRGQLRQTLALETLKPADERKADHEEALRRDLRTAEERVEALEARLQAEFPRYVALTTARELTQAELSALLRPGEALVLWLPTSRATYVFASRDGRVAAHRASVTLDDLERQVRSVRDTLQVADAGLKPFDVATAYQLYQSLLAPLADRLAGATHVVTVPAGPLLSLPPGTLVTRAPGPARPPDYRAVAWWGRDVGLSVLPSVVALRDLRAAARPSAAPRSFIGFGDPLFAGAAGDRRGLVAIATKCRDGDPADPAEIRALPRLPETAQELSAIGRVLGAGPDAVVLGASTTETRVRQADLSQYRTIAFATHAVLPGELRCRSEPSLVLTPPAAPTAADDGLLEASEVAQLRLDADWVVLSACNTAGPDGSLGGESLSGLARAFFYAGARALLVSHWAVASQPTVALTTGAFAAWARDPARGRSEALRQAQLALLGDTSTAHPFFWAPFALVGDGGPATTGGN